jgi:hypothetical protein
MALSRHAFVSKLRDGWSRRSLITKPRDGVESPQAFVCVTVPVDGWSCRKLCLVKAADLLSRRKLLWMVKTADGVRAVASFEFVDLNHRSGVALFQHPFRIIHFQLVLPATPARVVVSVQVALAGEGDRDSRSGLPPPGVI